MLEHKIEEIPQRSVKLGRQLDHDPGNRFFPLLGRIDRSSWVDRNIRIWDPVKNPNQRVGCCTAAAKCSQLNAAGNRRVGRVLNLSDAERMYARNTELDPYEGTWPPDDTGSSGLASCKTAIEFGLAGMYFWEFRGADGVVQNIQEGRVMSVGTWWYEGMFESDKEGIIEATGQRVGGHQYVARGYWKARDLILIRCWWGSYRDKWISRSTLNRLLLEEDGDAHFQYSA